MQLPRIMETMRGPAHTDRRYDIELDQIRSQVTKMGGEVRRMLARSLEALIAGDVEDARRIITADRVVNRLEIDTDELCMTVLARRQPVASDLRFITTALKINTDLERIGDLCAAICESFIALTAPVGDEIGDHLTAMGARVRIMMDAALRAFVEGDVKAAQRVIEGDRLIDQAYQDAFARVFDNMRCAAASVPDGIRQQTIAKLLERIGDHTTNIAEMVIFMVRGQDVRHPGRLTAVDGRNGREPQQSGGSRRHDTQQAGQPRT